MSDIAKYFASFKEGKQPQQPIVTPKTDVPLFNRTIYFLNKSRNKFVCVGFDPNINFSPVVKMAGMKNQSVCFDENEWKELIQNQGIITNYFYDLAVQQWKPIKLNFKTIHFLAIDGKKIIKIEDNDGEVFLGWESISELWNLLSIILYRIDILKAQEFNVFYNAVLDGVSKAQGDVINNITDLVNAMKDTKSENVNCFMELLNFQPERLKSAVDNLQQTNKY